MHVRFISGIGPAATDFYCRRLITTLAAEGAQLTLTLAHADTATLLRNQQACDVAAQVLIYLRLAERLKAAGAATIAITSIAGHFCIDPFAPVSPLPVINLLAVADHELSSQGLRRAGILGTLVVMETISTTPLARPRSSRRRATNFRSCMARMRPWLSRAR